MKDAIMKLKPVCKDYLWGGRRLIDEYDKEIDGDILAESWELSCHPDGPSMIASGTFEGMALAEYIGLRGIESVGKNCEKFDDFPMLIKLIDAEQNLSIQVHPDDAYANQYENQLGKTEVWYVVACKPGACLYFGVNKELTKVEFEQKIADNTIMEVLNEVPVKAGDVFFIEAGTIHAIGKGLLIAEVQQNSNVTYRVYDFGRTDAEGNTRELHVDKAVEVSKLTPSVQPVFKKGHIAQCEYFTVDKLVVEGQAKGMMPKDSFLSILVIDGTGSISIGEQQEQYKKGDSFFLPASEEEYIIDGQGEFLLSYIGE